MSGPKPKRAFRVLLAGSRTHSSTREKPMPRYIVSRIMRSTSFNWKSPTRLVVMSWTPARARSEGWTWG